ncbi:ACT domain-containing protein, partial [Bacillus subtilis]
MKEETFYLVREDVLPEAMRTTLEVKKLLDRKKAESFADAVQK